MHYIDSQNAKGGRWVGWDYQTGAKPTIGTPEWFNSVQEEIANVVLAAGITLDKNKNNQLLLAMSLLISKQVGSTLNAVIPSLKNDLKTEILAELAGQAGGTTSCQQVAAIIKNFATLDPVTGLIVFNCPTTGTASLDAVTGELLITIAGESAFDVVGGILTLTDTDLETYGYAPPNIEVINNYGN